MKDVFVPPPKYSKCWNESIWANKLRTMNIGDQFDAPINKRVNIYNTAKDMGYVVVARQFGRKDTVTFYMVSK